MNIQELHGFFINNNLTLGSVESFTGGSFASQITSISGASKFFKGSVVTYATEIKTELVGVDKNVVKKFGVVSSECAEEMASKGLNKLNTDVCISFTGNAGPSAMEDKTVGLIYIGLAVRNKPTRSFKYQLKGTRSEIIDKGLELGQEILLNFVK